MNEQEIHVLLVDDEESFRKPLTDYLRNVHGFIVDPVETSSQALRLLEEKQGRYDVALIDEVLTEPPSGLDVLRQIKAEYPDIEVILFTGWGMQAGIKALQAGAYRYLAKPLNKDELVMTIKFAAQQKRLRRERDYMAALVRVSQKLTQTTRLDEQLEVVWDFVRKELGILTCFVALYDPRTDILDSPLVYDEGIAITLPARKLNIDGSNWGLAGFVVKTGQEQVWYTREQAEKEWQKLRMRPHVSHKGPSESGICLPLRVGDKILGAMSMQSYTPYAFDQALLNTIRALGNQIAVAIQNSHLFNQVQCSRQAARAVARVSTLGKLDETLKAIVKEAREALHCDTTTLYVFDEHTQRFVHAECHGYINRNNLRSPEEVSRDSALWEIISLKEQAYRIAKRDSEDELLKGRFVEAEEIKSAMGVQLRFSDRRVGVLFINYRTDHYFIEDEIQDALQFADQAAVAIHNAQLHDEVRKHAEIMEGLYEAGKAITSTLSLEETLNHIAEQVLRVVGTGSTQEKCFTHIALREGDRLRLVAAWPPKMSTLLLKRIEIDLTVEGEHKIGIAGRCVNKGKPQNVGDVGNDRDYIKAVEYTKSQLSVPLKVGNEVIGVVSVEHPALNAFMDEDVRNLELLAAQAAVAIQNARRFEELHKMKETLAARTALAWTGMLGSTWRHAVEKHAITIREQIQLLRSDLPTKGKLDTISKRLEMIERLANQILEKPLTPPLSAEEGVISLPINDFLRERAKQLWAHEPYKSVMYGLDLKLDNLATVRVSPEWLRRALDILIDNAVEATAESPERKIVIGSQQVDHCAEIFITDNGRGIPPDVLERLFREPIKKPQGAKGQGIGLLLAQMIVQTYGGTISCRETGSTGTTMVISLPLEK